MVTSDCTALIEISSAPNTARSTPTVTRWAGAVPMPGTKARPINMKATTGTTTDPISPRGSRTKIFTSSHVRPTNPRQVRAFFETHGASRFESFENYEGQRTINRAGFERLAEDDTLQYLVLPEAFRREVCAGLDAKAVATLLVKRGWITSGDKGHFTQRVRVPSMGRQTRLYVFNSQLWEGDE